MAKKASQTLIRSILEDINAEHYLTNFQQNEIDDDDVIDIHKHNFSDFKELIPNMTIRSKFISRFIDSVSGPSSSSSSNVNIPPPHKKRKLMNVNNPRTQIIVSNNKQYIAIPTSPIGFHTESYNNKLRNHTHNKDERKQSFSISGGTFTNSTNINNIGNVNTTNNNNYCHKILDLINNKTETEQDFIRARLVWKYGNKHISSPESIYTLICVSSLNDLVRLLCVDINEQNELQMINQISEWVQHKKDGYNIILGENNIRLNERFMFLKDNHNFIVMRDLLAMIIAFIKVKDRKPILKLLEIYCYSNATNIDKEDWDKINGCYTNGKMLEHLHILDQAIDKISRWFLCTGLDLRKQYMEKIMNKFNDNDNEDCDLCVNNIKQIERKLKYEYGIWDSEYYLCLGCKDYGVIKKVQKLCGKPEKQMMLFDKHECGKVHQEMLANNY